MLKYNYFQFKWYRDYKFLNIGKRQYLSHYWSDKGFKGTVVIQAMPSLIVSLLKITLTVLKKGCNTKQGTIYFL